MKKIFCIAFILFVAFNIQSQVKVNNDGKLLVGGERVNDDSLGVISMQVFGKHGGEFRTGSRIAFGDYGRLINNGSNCFVGEYDTTDTDKLHVHGKNGIYFSNWQEEVVFKIENDKVFYHNDEVQSSDRRLKKEIENLNGTLDLVKQINGVSFKRKMQNPVNEGNPQSKKEKADMAKLKYIKNKNVEQLKFGFIAQDLLPVVPELVEQDSTGYYYVNYTGMIPLLLEAIKEQQVLIESLSVRIKHLENGTPNNGNNGNNNGNSGNNNDSIPDNTDDGSGSVGDNSDDDETGVEDNSGKAKGSKLFQNEPNPFNGTTIIRYTIPASIKQAHIKIYDMSGNLKDSHEIFERGNNSIVINIDYEPGVYVYALIVDGIKADSKEMIVTR